MYTINQSIQLCRAELTMLAYTCSTWHASASSVIMCHRGVRAHKAWYRCWFFRCCCLCICVCRLWLQAAGLKMPVDHHVKAFIHQQVGDERCRSSTPHRVVCQTSAVSASAVIVTTQPPLLPNPAWSDQPYLSCTYRTDALHSRPAEPDGENRAVVRRQRQFPTLCRCSSSVCVQTSTTLSSGRWWRSTRTAPASPRRCKCCVTGIQRGRHSPLWWISWRLNKCLPVGITLNGWFTRTLLCNVAAIVRVNSDGLNDRTLWRQRWLQRLHIRQNDHTVLMSVVLWRLCLLSSAVKLTRLFVGMGTCRLQSTLCMSRYTLEWPYCTGWMITFARQKHQWSGWSERVCHLLRSGSAA